jgi:hypothetical protein
MRHLYLFLFLLASLLFLLHYLVVGNGVWGDGRYYYVFTRSWVIDHDIDFSNERLVNPFYFDFTETPLGRAGNKYSIGPALMWLPPFILAHLLSLLLNLPADGYGHLYRLAIGLYSVGLITAALYFIHRTLKRLYPHQNHLPVILTLGLGTHLFYYFALDPITSHAPSVFISSLIVYLLTFMPSAIILGLLTGFLGMIRPHDLIFALPVAFSLKILKSKIYYLASVGFAYSPQLLTQYLLYGTLKSPYFLLGEGFNLLTSHPLSILFSTNNGLFLFSPLWLFGLIGLYSLKNRFPLARYGLLLFALQTLILGSWSGWWGGASFGGRMFLSLTPFIALGLSAIYHQLSFKLTLVVSHAAIIFTWVLALHFLLTH